MPTKITEELVIASAKVKQTKTETKEQFLNRVTHLHLNNKDISKIENLEICPNLHVLYLYDNKISVIEKLESFSVTLTHLYLQNNLISDLKPLAPLRNLIRLYLNGNRISVVEGLQNMKKLEELHICNQYLATPESTLQFSPATISAIGESLTLLDISRCNLSSCSALAPLSSVKTINLSFNQISSLTDLKDLLRGTKNLKILDLSENPVSKLKNYRRKVITSCSLQELDGKEVTQNERIFLQNLARQKKDKIMKNDINFGAFKKISKVKEDDNNDSINI